MISRTLVNKVKGVFIDTCIWSLAYKIPRKNRFKGEEEYKEALELHIKASEFLKKNLEDNIIYMTYFQVMEIFHVLGFRGTKLQLKIAKSITDYILKSPKIVKVEIPPTIYKKCLELSAETGIHIWDFLCILPLKDLIDKAYSMDKHFQHKVFKELGIHVENPFGIWITT